MAEINENKPSEKAFNGFYIPAHNAKLIKEGLEKGDSPLLPGADGTLNPTAIYNSRTGYILPASVLIPAQIAKAENNFESNLVSTSFNLREAGTQRKTGEKGLWFNYKAKDGTIQTTQYLFGDQAENPKAVIDYANRNKIKDRKALDGINIELDNPDNYLSAYLAAAKSGLKVEVKPEVVNEFKEKMTKICENQMKNTKDRDKDIPLLNNYLFDNDQKSIDIIKEVAQANKIELSPKQKEQTKKEPEKKHEHKKEEISISR